RIWLGVSDLLPGRADPKLRRPDSERLRHVRQLSHEPDRARRLQAAYESETQQREPEPHGGAHRPHARDQRGCPANYGETRRGRRACNRPTVVLGELSVTAHAFCTRQECHPRAAMSHRAVRESWVECGACTATI